MISKITLDGESLSIKDICTIIKDPSLKVEVSLAALEKIKKSKEILDKNLEKQIMYGINTGFGPMASFVIGRGQLLELQENLIRSHAVGIGEPIDSSFSLAAMIVRLNTLAKGNSGVSPALLKQLEDFINHRIIPVIPEHGAVGTSGDLVQLAHIALSLIGEGEVFYSGKIQKTKEVLKQVGIQPYKLQPKEGLALINGTSVMAAISALVVDKSEKLLNLSIKNGALALELVQAYDDSISEVLQSVRPHLGQQKVAEKLRNIVSSSKLMRDRVVLSKTEKVTDHVHQIPHEVQNVYSIRCIPQILGPILETLEKVKSVVEIEINSSTDNPIVDIENEKFIHGGNFHGDYISSHIDFLKIAIVKLTMLSERRTNFFLHDKINEKFPPFMNLKTPGLTLGLQGLQFVATSTTAQNQTLAFPQYVHSIPTNGDNQDVVSMGTDSALLAAKVIENAFVVISIEAVVLAQGVDYLGVIDSLSKETGSLFRSIRGIFKEVREDRSMSLEMNELVAFLKS